MASPPTRILVIGAGFGGIAATIELRRAGYTEITVIDKADGVGGTWRANTYPGAACDIPCHLYSLSFAPKADWTRRYATQPEILAYLEEVVDRWGLRRHLRLGVAIVEARFDDTGVWTARAASGEVYQAEVLIAATGQLSRPATPAIDGLERFGGTLLHTARWDPAFSARGRRVAVVGTGASAVQLVPELARTAEKLCVIQRNPPWILPKNAYGVGGRVHELVPPPWSQHLDLAGFDDRLCAADTACRSLPVRASGQVIRRRRSVYAPVHGAVRFHRPRFSAPGNSHARAAGPHRYRR